MIKVALVSTQLPERCGLAQYADDLCVHMVSAGDVEYRLIGRPFTVQSVMERVGDCEIIHVNHVWSMFDWSPADIRNIKASGKKIMCTLQESGHDPMKEKAFVTAFDRVVVHRNHGVFNFIPHGLWDLRTVFFDAFEKAYDGFIGSAGFPFPFKNYPLIAQIAKEVGMKVLLFAPESHHVDQKEVDDVLTICPGSAVITDYRNPIEIIRELSRCTFTMFPQSPGNSGISGSVRLGIAARRPIVISDNYQFSDFEGHGDELYVIPYKVPNFNNTMPTVQQLLSDMAEGKEKVPCRLIDRMGWPVVANMYYQVYKDLAGHE